MAPAADITCVTQVIDICVLTPDELSHAKVVEELSARKSATSRLPEKADIESGAVVHPAGDFSAENHRYAN